MGMVFFLVNAFMAGKGLIFCLDLACATGRTFGQREKRKNQCPGANSPSENAERDARRVARVGRKLLWVSII
jgi:hypothetical protein